MKTKHLFLATALMASFAACTNEEIVSDVQQNVATGRPTVENVKLTFGENVDSRLIYNKGWKWEATDQIGALLMDQPADLTKTVWQDKYTLSQYIHTSYPFSYNTEDETWGTPGKLLEGNYFFAYPWESYEGHRQVAHSLINQKQTGITADVRAESYADNQFFIGYDRIIAGTQDAEALNNVSMTSVLGAIELRIVNTGTQTYNINKVVLSGTQLASQLTFDPTTSFNSANYLGYDWEAAYTADDLEDYDKVEALRAVVKPVQDEINDKFAQIIIEGEERALLPDAENTAYVLIMANPVKKADLTDLKLSIYTDEGIVTGINLKQVNSTAASLAKYGYKTDAAVKEIHPEVKNVITVQLDDNAFEIPETMDIYNTLDLEQFIEWNATISGKREITATLHKDVTLTSEAYEALVAKGNMELTINGSSKVLTLDEEIPANVLENENLDINSKVKALCDIDLTKKSNIPAAIEVAEGAELTINEAGAKVCDITNYGTLTIGEKANIKSNEYVNYGVMTVAKEAFLTKTSTVKNYGTLIAKGYIKTIVENGDADNIEAEITVGKDADVTVTTNYGVITTNGNLAVGENKAKAVINYEEGDLAVTTKGGEIRAELSGTVDAETTEDLTAINTWIITDDVTFDDDENALTYATVIVEAGVDVAVEAGTSVTVTKLVVEGTTIVEGVINAGTVVVEESAKLTVDEDAVVKVATLIDNDGVVVNNGTVELAVNGDTTGEGDWRGNDLDEKQDTTSQDEFNEVLNKFVQTWIDNKSGVYSWENVTYDAIEGTGWTSLGSEWAKTIRKELVEAYNSLEGLTGDDKLEENNDDVTEILEEYKTSIEAYIAAAPGNAEDALESAITTAIANKDLTFSWKNAGYAYVGNLSSIESMWIQYGEYLNNNLKNWAVKNAETKEMELVYQNADKNLKQSYALAIKTAITDKLAIVEKPSDDLLIDGAYLDASDEDGTAYVVMDYIVNTLHVDKTIDEFESQNLVTLSAIKAWFANMNKAEDKIADEYLVHYAILKDYVDEVLAWTAPEYSDANLLALAGLLKATKVTTAAEFTSALANGGSIILSGDITLTNVERTVNKSVSIKGGTIIGGALKFAKAVTLNNVIFKNSGRPDGKGSAVYVLDNAENVNIKNCTFDGFEYDAIQVNDQISSAVVVIENNTFVAPSGKKAKSQFIDIAYTNGNAENKIIIKDNNFGVFTNFEDYPIKVYGIKSFDQIIVGGNTFETAYDAAKKQILVTKNKDDESATAADSYDKEDVYNAFKGSLKALNATGKDAE